MVLFKGNVLAAVHGMAALTSLAALVNIIYCTFTDVCLMDEAYVPFFLFLLVTLSLSLSLLLFL